MYISNVLFQTLQVGWLGAAKIMIIYDFLDTYIHTYTCSLAHCSTTVLQCSTVVEHKFCQSKLAGHREGKREVGRERERRGKTYSYSLAVLSAPRN